MDYSTEALLLSDSHRWINKDQQIAALRPDKLFCIKDRRSSASSRLSDKFK